MGDIFRQAEKFIDDTPGAFVEIGSDRWEGSTTLLSELAGKYNRQFHSVDIDDAAQRRLGNTAPNTQFHVMVGSQWCQEVWPAIGEKIRLLYLDNFDYDWNVRDLDNPMINEQKLDYLERFGLEMNNQNCQVEHMKQIIALYPYLADRCTVICDDSYLSNECWIGKCGGVILFLLAQGFHIAQTENVQGNSYGAILCR